MFFYLALALVVVPAVEIALILKVKEIEGVGWANTIAIIILTGLAGSWLARREGARAWRAIQEALAAGHIPTREAIDGLLILAAGLVLLTPGFVTDVLGFLLLIPVTRIIFRTWLVGWCTRHVTMSLNVQGFGAPSPSRPEPMAGEVIDVDAEPVKAKPPEALDE